MIERYQTQEMRRIFHADNRFALFIEIEALLLQALPKSLRIPAADIKALRALQKHIDATAIERIEAATRHEVTAFLEWIWGRLKNRPAIAKYLHLGLTSSDLMDTALSCQIDQAFGTLKTSLLETLRL
ncbi:MAG: adenylosuccinate lyase, partial [Elusimicrobiota bacterium]